MLTIVTGQGREVGLMASAKTSLSTAPNFKAHKIQMGFVLQEENCLGVLRVFNVPFTTKVKVKAVPVFN
jgi:hypothetical protein